MSLFPKSAIIIIIACWIVLHLGSKKQESNMPLAMAETEQQVHTKKHGADFNIRTYEQELLDAHHLEYQKANYPFNLDSPELKMIKAHDRFNVSSNLHEAHLQILPKNGSWNMAQVHTLGLEFHNISSKPLIVTVRVDGEAAEDWFNCSHGKGVLEPQEQLMIGTHLTRPHLKQPHPIYQKMFGRPNGHASHWLNIDTKHVKKINVHLASHSPLRFSMSSDLYSKNITLQKSANSQSQGHAIVDEYGQYALKDWSGKVKKDDDFITHASEEDSLFRQHQNTLNLSIYGGWKDGPRYEATGHFRIQKISEKWWFIDPEGYLFWSYGVNGLGANSGASSISSDYLPLYTKLPNQNREHESFFSQQNQRGWFFSFYKYNLFRKYGLHWEVEHQNKTMDRFHKCGLNTAASWSDRELLKKHPSTYTPTLYTGGPQAAKNVPDPFHHSFHDRLESSLIPQLKHIQHDPYCLGVFVDNELHWENNPCDLLRNILCHQWKSGSRDRLISQLQKKYQQVSQLNKAWNSSFKSWQELEENKQKDKLKHIPMNDAHEFVAEMAEIYYSSVHRLIQVHAPKTLYLGSRFNSASPAVLDAINRYADVISVNHYTYHPNLDSYSMNGTKPVIISEFHFANMGEGNLGPGLRSATNAIQQGRQLKAYATQALLDPNIIGVHWFQWGDQSILGRFDGENYQVGFYDITDKAHYAMLFNSTMISNHMYRIRSRSIDPWGYTIP